MVKELDIKEIKERCLELSIEQNDSQIYEYLKEELREEFEDKIRHAENSM